MGRKRRWKRKGETKDRQNPRTRARRARTYVARLGSVHVDVVGNDVTNEIRARQVLSRVRRRRRKCRAGTGNDTTRLFVVGHPDVVSFRPSTFSDTAVSSSRRPRWRIRLRARRFSLASMSTHRVATMTRVRRCLEEAKGGLELAWRVDVAAALQRMCERASSSAAASSSTARTSPPAPILPVEVTGHTTPALADIGRASLRVRFTSPDASQHPTGGLILGIRRHPDERFLPAVAAAPGDRGPDRHGATRESLAELVIMARPLHEDEDDASASEIDGDDSGGIRTLARGVAVTSVDDETLRDWARVGHASAEVIILRRVTDFHLGLNAHRWLKIRMRQIADGAESLAATEASTVSRDSRATLEAYLRGTGFELDPSGRVRPRPPDASFLFEHWGAGGNTGISGQVTGYEGELVAMKRPP